MNIKNVFSLTELWSTEKSYTVPFKETSPCSSFVKSFDSVSKQKLYQLMLSFALNLQMFYLLTSNSHHHCNVNLSIILYFALLNLILFLFYCINAVSQCSYQFYHQLVLHLILKIYFFHYQHEMMIYYHLQKLQHF